MSQVGKNLGMLGGLVVGATALGLYAYFGVMKGGEQEAKAKEISAQVFPAATAEGPSASSAFKKLTVIADGQTTELSHDAKGWSITSPVQAPADADVVEGIVSALSHDTFKATVEEHPSKDALAKYGLDAPKFQLSAVFQKPGAAAQTVTFQGGIENSFDGSVYVRRAGEDAVHAISGTFKVALEKSTFQLRDKRLIRFEEAALRRIDLTQKGATASLTLDDAKHWHLASPIQELADDGAVKALWTAVQTNPALAFPKDSPDARKDFGLTTPTLKATFTPKDGPAVTLTLAKMGADKDVRAFAAIEAGGHTTLAQVPPALLDALSPKVDSLRDHSVLSFEDKQVQRVSYQPKAGAAAIELSREKGKDGSLEDWKVTAPKKEAAKGWKVSSMLWALHSLKAVAFGPAHPSEKEWAKHGIDAKARTITLFGAGDQVLAKLVVGSPLKDKADHLWVRGAKDQVLEIDAKSLSELPKSLDALADTPAPAAPKAQAAAKP